MNFKGVKIGNEYARLLSYYERIPKAVLAAIAVSYATSGGDYLSLADSNVAREQKDAAMDPATDSA